MKIHRNVTPYIPLEELAMKAACNPAYNKPLFRRYDSRSATKALNEAKRMLAMVGIETNA